MNTTGIMKMNQLPILIRREFWEHRNTFVILPAVATGFLLLLMLLAVLASASSTISVSVNMQGDSDLGQYDRHLDTDNIYQFALHRLGNLAVDDKARYLKAGLHSLGTPLLVVLWFVIFFYLMGALYYDRRDRSILFWKSMPVSDAMTVFSKLLTALVVVPLVYLACVAFLQFSALLLITFAAAGTNVSIWESVWAPAGVLGLWAGYLAVLMFYALWSLPFYSWLLAVSAYAKSVPLVWAVALPLVITVLERIVTSQSLVGDWMRAHVSPQQLFDQQMSIPESIRSNLLSLQMLSAVLVGAVLIVLTIWLRSKADEM